MVLEIPDEIVHALRIPERRADEELRKEFAVFLVREGLLSRPMARRLAGMERVEFDDLLARRQVPWEGTIDDVLKDAEAAETAALQRSPAQTSTES